MLPYSVIASGDITIVSPGAICTTDLSEIKVGCSDAEKIIFELDGVKIGETNGETVLPLEEGAISVGNHKLKVSAIFPDKTAAQKEICFNAHKMVNVKPFTTLNFNSYEKGKESNAGITPNARGKIDFLPDTGVTSAAGDLSVKVAFKSTDAVARADAPTLTVKNFTNYGAKGILTIKYNIKITDANLTVRMSDMPLAYNHDSFVMSGKLRGTSGVLNLNAWNSVEVKIDYDANRSVIKLNDGVVYDGVPVNYKTYSKSTVVDFAFEQSGSTRTEAGAVWFDNIELKQEYKYGLDSIVFSDGTVWSSGEFATVSSDTASIKLMLTEGLTAASVTKDNISLYENGNKVDIDKVIYSDGEKSVTIIPKNEFAKDSEITAELSNKIKLSAGKETGVALKAMFRTEKAPLTPESVTFKKGSSPLVSSSQIEEGDVISTEVKLNNDTSEHKNMTVMVYVRQNKKLRSIGAAQAYLAPGQKQPVTVTLPEIKTLDSEGDISVKMTVMDTFDNALPYMLFTEIN